MASNSQISATHQRVIYRFIAAQGSKPFRRQDIADALYPHIRPRLMDNARALADKAMQALQRERRLVKAGHVHWSLVVPTSRTLKSSRVVPEHKEVQQLTLSTHCPQKWVAVDLETGDVWAGSNDGWKRATAAVRGEALAALSTVDSERDAPPASVSDEHQPHPCWSCREDVTKAERAANDGQCPHCDAELDLSMWPQS